MRIDLHTHSSASDGTDAPADVVAAAAAAGLDVVALTDHDTTAGWDEAAVAARAHGIALVRGTEVSARSRGISIHLLSYLQDPTHPALLAELDRTRRARLDRARLIVERLAADHPITWQDVLEQSQDAVVVGRPHIADALVARGVVPDRDAAFVDLLASRGRYHVPHHAPEAVVAVQAIRAAGGVPCSPTRVPTGGGVSSPTGSSTSSPRPGWQASRSTTATTTRPSAHGWRRSPNASDCSSRARATTTVQERPTGWGRI